MKESNTDLSLLWWLFGSIQNYFFLTVRVRWLSIYAITHFCFVFLLLLFFVALFLFNWFDSCLTSDQFAACKFPSISYKHGSTCIWYIYILNIHFKTSFLHYSVLKNLKMLSAELLEEIKSGQILIASLMQLVFQFGV